MAVLTKEGSRKVNSYIAELAAKKKGILDAGIDTARNTLLPTAADIENGAMGIARGLISFQYPTFSSTPMGNSCGI